MNDSVPRISTLPRGWSARGATAVVFVSVLGVLLFVDRVQMDRAIALDDERLRILAEEFAIQVSSEVVQRLELTRGLGAVAQADPDFAADRFDDLASSLGRDLPGLISLQLAPGGVVRHVTEPDRNSAVIGLDLFSSANDSAAARAAVFGRRMVIQGPFPLTQGGTGVVGRRPIFRSGVTNVTGSSDFWGFATVVFSIDAIIEAAASEFIPEDALFSLVAGSSVDVDGGSTSLSSRGVRHVSVSVALPEGAVWRVEVGRSGALPSELLFWRPWLWALGLMSTLLAGWATARIFSFQSKLRTQVDMATRELSSALRRAHEAQESATSANSAKSELLRRVSHEFRTPLNAILGYSEVLLDHTESGLSEKQVRWIANIESSGRHLLSLVNQLLKFTRGEHSSDEDTIGPLLIVPIVSECIDLIRPDAEARAIHIEVALDESNELPVMANITSLRQVLLNLFSNAVKYNREGGLIRVNAQTTSLGRLRVTVEDTGHGLSSDDQRLVFEPFSRFTRGESPDVEGFGLGLFITQDLVRLMGGEVGVTSQLGQGSMFWFEVPLAE